MPDVKHARPSWDEYGLALAQTVSLRADCQRRKVGVCILDKEHRLVSTGYNGAYPGGPSCLKGECPRGLHYRAQHLEQRGVAPSAYPDGRAVCACGADWPCPESVPPGSSYDTGLGACVAIHAELNAILFADRERLQGATLYITDPPCDGCAKHIRSTAIRRVVWPEGGYENG